MAVSTMIATTEMAVLRLSPKQSSTLKILLLLLLVGVSSLEESPMLAALFTRALFDHSFGNLLRLHLLRPFLTVPQHVERFSVWRKAVTNATQTFSESEFLSRINQPL